MKDHHQGNEINIHLQSQLKENIKEIEFINEKVESLSKRIDTLRSKEFNDE